MLFLLKNHVVDLMSLQYSKARLSGQGPSTTACNEASQPVERATSLSPLVSVAKSLVMIIVLIMAGTWTLDRVRSGVTKIVKGGGCRWNSTVGSRYKGSVTGKDHALSVSDLSNRQDILTLQNLPQNNRC